MMIFPMMKMPKNIYRINDMIDLEVDPKVIKDAIATSTHMKTGTRQKLLDRVDKDLETHIKEGMKKGMIISINRLLRAREL